MADTTTGQAQTTPDAGGEGLTPAAAQSADKTFSQAQLDAIITERLAREKTKYADYDDLKKFRETQEQASKTEIEKLTDAKAKAEQEAKTAREQAAAKILNAEARAVAAEMGFSKPDKAIKLADFAKAIKDGEIDAAEVKSALEALAKEMPELLKPAGSHISVTNPSKGSAQETDVKRVSDLALGKANIPGWFSEGSLVINSTKE